MTGAGSSSIAFATETSFGTLPDIPTWIQPGEDIEVGEASLDRALSRARQPDDPRPDGSRAGNREGALSVSFSLTDTNWHDLVFPATSPVGLATTAQLAPTASWYLSSDTPGNTEERFLQGAAVESMSINYNQGEDVTVDLTIIAGQEIGAGDAESPDVPGSIQQPDKDDIATFAGVDLTIAGVTVEYLQSMSIDVSGMARFRRGQQQEPIDAVVGAYEPSANVQAILQDSTQRELAYGSTSATQPADAMDESSGSLAIDNPAGALATYNLVGMKPTTFDWSDLVSAETDITDPVDYHVNDVTVA